MTKETINFHAALVTLILTVAISCKSEFIVPNTAETKVSNIADPNTWIFLMAGQSNMAGRGLIDSKDQITDERFITINQENQWILGKEPLHLYEPGEAGLDCGMSFAHRILDETPDSITVAMVPCAVGGSSVYQWLNDDEHRGVRLLTNFKQKVTLAKKKGIIKGLIWHQGERDANAEDLPGYKDALTILFSKFRSIAGDDELPIIMGELGRFAIPAQKAAHFEKINITLSKVADESQRVFVVSSEGLDHKGDHLHFNSEAQRELGRRYASVMLEHIKYKK